MANVQETHTVLIVDDHPLLREGVGRRISRHQGLKVCGEADDVEEALKLARDLHPDVLIVDIALKTGNGIDLIKQLRSRRLDTKILVHSMYDDFLYAERSLQAGAQGYINKQQSPDELIVAIERVLGGDIYLSPFMTQRVLGNVACGAPSKPVGNAEQQLSDRELEIFSLIGSGLTTSQIADQLRLSHHTIDSHCEKIKTKLRLANAAELRRRAFQWTMENN